MDNTFERFDSESILYELLEYLVKKQDPELIKCKNDSAILVTTGTIKNALRYLNNRYSLPESISQQISLTLPWKFSIGDNGRLLAILQENFIEIRKAKDEFSSVIGKATVPKDAFPQWRKILWSPDGSILVVASSNGYLSFYNSLGNNIFNISPKTISQNPDILEAGDAISSLMFSEPKDEKDKWTFAISLVTYSGLLKSYNISGVHGFKQNYEFSFGKFYRQGVNAIAFDKIHNLYIVAGNSITQNLLSPAANTGLTSWRPLNDYPYYKLSFTFEESSMGQSALSLWNLIPSFRAPPEPVIFRISISPNCNNLVCLHTDGSISLWALPNLQLKKKWYLNEQPDYNAQNPSGVTKYKKFPAGLTEFHPVDIGWWSNYAIIVARYSGAVSVCSMVDLKNLLGISPEFLYGQPQISEFYLGKGFLCLDCETFITSKKRKREPSHDGHISETSDSEKEEDELEPITLFNYTTNLVQSAIYSMTDIEKFQPKRKKSKILHRTYRILGLKSTTPEELYSRKIDIEEYDEALSLANAYNLDTDLVYQTRWRKSEFSVKAIQDHLSKVSKRSWVLDECIMRVPETLEAARELLNFGLEGANLETLKALTDSDDGKFVAEDEYEDENVIKLDKVSENIRRMQKANEILSDMDLSNLSQSQKDLVNYRKKLLNHLDKLLTYKILIQEPNKYEKEIYQEFRRLSIVENAIKFAKDCNFRAVDIMFTYHGSKLMPHWLGIISCFPETLNPIEYKKLLPECDKDGQLFLIYQRELRQLDWAEKCEFETITEHNNDDSADVIYKAEPSLSAYRNTVLTMDLLTKWYKSRAYQIERDSCIVENALELIKIGKIHRITGLEALLVELETLDDLVYKVFIEDMSLLKLEKLSDLEKIKLLMSTSKEKNFVMHIKNYVIPFIDRKQKYLGGELNKKLISDYLIMLSEEDLTLAAEFFKHLMQDSELIEIIDDIMTLSLNCIYSCTNPESYKKAREIFDSIPKPLNSRDTPGVSNAMEELEKELDSLQILNKYNVKTTIRFINENKLEPEKVKLLLNEMANNLKNKIPTPNQEAWSELLNDMLEIHEWIFTCIDIDVCFDICVAARLASGSKVNIQNCASLIETNKDEKSLLKVSYTKAIELILEASQEYFDSCKSSSDSNMELAKACLHLIEDDNPAIQKEYQLINALQILEEFNVNKLPLHIRLCQDRLKLIEYCLNNCEGAYKRQDRLLALASYLYIENNNRRIREGKVLELVAFKAFEVKDFKVCSSVCKKMMENSYHPFWKITQKLGFCDDYRDLMFREKCLWFAITYGPGEILEDSLKQMHLLEIQVLNKNLENWVTTHQINNLPNEEDNEDEFGDALSTPQSEVKEYVPKIFGTSTGLVKSSAQIFKQSTLGILKNVGNQNFWKTALNINLEKTGEDSLEIEENVTKEKLRGEIQSFPYFYQTLHDQCLISRINTNYSKYSMPDVEDTKLKMFQTLLRISTLSETACYGLVISDINHFFVQSSSHIMPDDWLLGVSYLLNLKDDIANYANEVFKNLPNTDLYKHTAMYFYSLMLYQKLNPENTQPYLIDPVDLMKEMIKKSEENPAEEFEEVLRYWHKQLTDKNKPKVEDKEKIVEEKKADIEEEGWDHELDIEDELINHENVYEMNEKKENLNENVEEGWDHDFEIEDDLIDDKIVPEANHEEVKINNAVEGWDNELEIANNLIDDTDQAVSSSQITEFPIVSETKNLYHSEAFKMTSSSGAEEGNGWEDNWDDFSDHSVENVQTTSKKHSEKNRISTETGSLENLPNKNHPDENSTEQKRFEMFQKYIANLSTKDDYLKLKSKIKNWPAFIEGEFTSVENHPTLRMIESVNLVFNKSNSSHRELILREYKELLHEKIVPLKLFETFLKQFDEKCSQEERIYLRLQPSFPDLHQEAINMIKSEINAEFAAPILEQIFFNNLTSCFEPHQPIYSRILEEIFLNHDLLEVEPNIRILINKLMEQKNVPYAIALWNQLAAVPPALSTFESCLQLFSHQ